ncbi:MAG: glycosidase [Desulfurococcales archaeon ex4484_58]|nr:MAG: glycosidase [Desulfurococcales archaeon ex4484_58]
MDLRDNRFSFIEGGLEARDKRVFDVNDIVVRAGVISPDRIYLHNYPIQHPISAFNASVHDDSEYLHVYVRIILGYYMYVSSIIELKVPWEDLIYGYVDMNSYSGDIIVYPSTKYDVWGTEDPRVYNLDNQLFMTYTGRSINYFNPVVRKNRTLPVTAVYNAEDRAWYKKYVFIPSEEVFGNVISDKDAFLHRINNTYYLFHRPHLEGDTFHLLVSIVEQEKLLKTTNTLTEVIIDNAYEVLPLSEFESKIGWAAPPVPLNNKGDVIVFVHSVDRENIIYRLFAIELVLKREEIVVKAVTPRYIMEPKTPYEVIGDRPFTIFPCGALRFNKNHVLITYGAGDYMVGFGIIDLNSLLEELDRGRIFE